MTSPQRPEAKAAECRDRVIEQARGLAAAVRLKGEDDVIALCRRLTNAVGDLDRAERRR